MEFVEVNKVAVTNDPACLCTGEQKIKMLAATSWPAKIGLFPGGRFNIY